MNLEEKECPYCKELIKARAIKCRYCGGDLSDGRNSNLNFEREDVPSYLKQNSRKNYGGWIFIGLIAAILAFTNPTEKDFKYEMVKRIQESGELDRADMFGKLMVGLASYAIESITERKNYVLFSIFEIDSSLFRIVDPEVPRLRFIGIAGQVIPLWRQKGELLTSSDNSTITSSDDSTITSSDDSTITSSDDSIKFKVVDNPKPKYGYQKYTFPAQNEQVYFFDLLKMYPSLENTLLSIADSKKSLVKDRLSGPQSPIENYNEVEILANSCVTHMCKDNEITIYINKNGAIAFYIIDDGFDSSTKEFNKKLMYFSNFDNPKYVPSKLYKSMEPYLNNPDYQLIEDPDSITLNISKDIVGRVMKNADRLNEMAKDENEELKTQGLVIKHSELNLSVIENCASNIDVGNQKYPLGKTLKTFFDKSYAFVHESGDYLLSESCEDDILKTCNMRAIDFRKNKTIQYQSQYTDYKNASLKFSDFMNRSLVPEDDMIWSDIKSICKFKDSISTSNFLCKLDDDNLSCQNLRSD